MKTLFSTVLVLATASVAAHEGHGVPGVAHWHATDAVGYLLIAVLAVGAAWWTGRK